MDTVSEFSKGLTRWRKGADISLREQARQIGCSPSLLVLIAQGERQTTDEFMASAIAAAPQPWDAVLKQARQEDRDAADAAMAERVTA